MNRGYAARLLALVGITAIWGGTFVMVKDAVNVYPVAGFLGYRFAIAAIVFLPFVRRVSWASIRAGLPIGVVMGAAYIVQTIGLHFTLASDTGLITGLSAILVPLIDWLVFRIRITGLTIGALAIAIVGLILLVGGLPKQLALGDALVALSAIGFAVQIILLSRRSPSYDTPSLTLGLMLGAAAVFVAAAMTPMGGGLALPPPSIWPAILFTAVFASALGFFVQAWAQGKLPATPAAIVLLTEPAWAAFFGVLLSGNPFPPIRIIGAGLLLATPIVMTLAESRAGRRILIYVRGERGEPAAA